LCQRPRPVEFSSEPSDRVTLSCKWADDGSAIKFEWTHASTSPATLSLVEANLGSRLKATNLARTSQGLKPNRIKSPNSTHLVSRRMLRVSVARLWSASFVFG